MPVPFFNTLLRGPQADIDAARKVCTFRLLAPLLVLAPTVLIIDVVMRVRTEGRFVIGEYTYLRPPHNIEEMKRPCASSGIQFAIVYIPTNAHTILTLVKDRLPADQVRAFVAIKAKKDRPEDGAFLTQFLPALEIKEDITRAWCASNDVPFVSLTEPFREAILKGRQVYLTYNDHLTPVGQDVAAQSVVTLYQRVEKGDRHRCVNLY